MQKRTLKAEIIRCGTDPEYFIRKYVKIQHPIRGLIPFALYDYQETLLKSYQENRWNIVLKARQLGISEATAAFATWLMLFRRHKNIIVIASKKEVAANIIRKVKTAVANIPKWLFLTKIKTDNVFSIEFANGSRIKAVATAKDAGRSEAGSLLIIDEAAHIEGMDDIWTGLRPVVSAGGNVIMLSTPKGTENVFHREYAHADLGMSEFKPTKLMWWVHPERVVDEEGLPDLEDDPMRPGFKTSSWFRKETSGMDPREIAQELETNFNASGDNFIAYEHMQWIEKETMMTPFLFLNSDRNLHVWSECVPGEMYFMAADVARGDGNDSSAVHVMRASDMSQVAEYCGKLPPDEFADLLCRLGKDWNNALMVVENNSMGLACIEHVKMREYSNIYFSEKGDFKPGKAFDASMPLPPFSEYVPGFTTTQRTRPLIMQELEECIRTKSITIRSQRTASELSKFVWNNGRPEAQRGYNDDLVISLAIACWIKKMFLAPYYTSADTNLKMLGMIDLKTKVHTDIPGATKDPRFIRANERMIVNRNDPYKLAMQDGRFEDLGWLLTRK